MPKSIDWEIIEAKLMDARYDDIQIAQVMPKLREIDRLRHEKQAIILAHYYQIPPIQMIADVKGDSLALAMAAREIKDARLIVSSTVHFMAEMVKLLSPDKKVVIPGLGASCSIAEGMNGATIRKMREYLSDAKIIAYINTTAEVKAEVDVICTSANAKTILERMEGDTVIMLPDSFFAENIFKDMNGDKRTFLAYRRIENNAMVFYDPREKKEYALPLSGARAPERAKGTCVVHEQFSAADVEHYRKREKIDLVLAHPEVHPDVAAVADVVGGTGKMIKVIGNSKAKKILYLTECDLAAPLMEAYPNREFITPCKLCPYMKKNTIDSLLYSLQEEQWEVTVDPRIADRARSSLERMFELTG